MNTRCYRCGRSFSIGREAVEAAAVASAGQKFHVVYCPNCRTATKLPMDQLMRELPPGWQPPAPAADEPVKPAEPESSLEPEPEAEPEAEPAHKSHRRHRRAKGSNAPDDAAAVMPPPVEPARVAVAEPPAAEPAPEQPTAEAGPAKKTRKRKAAAETGSADSDAEPPAAAAKKAVRKRAKSKSE